MIPILQAQGAVFDPEIAAEFGYAVTQGASFLGVPLMDSTGLMHLLIRFAFNLLVSFILVKFLYFKKGGRKEYFLTFMLFSSAMFILLFLLESVKLQIGLTLGLFAIFGMVRYRTTPIPVREITYLFIIISLSIINGISLSISYVELLSANALVLALTWACEKSKKSQQDFTKIIIYDKLELITPDKREELREDLQRRLGLEIENIEVGSVNFLKDTAYVKIWYKPLPGEENTLGDITKMK